ncbi:hypothetical protein BTN50_0820 [Candidatus Enterovibrio altilux]|uniref:Uncharacterized protein n=1 Tax=Candidatus Enterovibrio altilux TaxID=1927128 RepID=A0A291B8J8_9GAMM|nr:hypothetical protein BTN50_0820 [Candidatus Enterovibrio luxaltus]
MRCTGLQKCIPQKLIERFNGFAGKSLGMVEVFEVNIIFTY